jgi:hypothetical protein
MKNSPSCSTVSWNNTGFLVPTGSEAVRGHSPDPSRADPVRAQIYCCSAGCSASGFRSQRNQMNGARVPPTEHTAINSTHNSAEMFGIKSYSSSMVFFWAVMQCRLLVNTKASEKHTVTIFRAWSRYRIGPQRRYYTEQQHRHLHRHKNLQTSQSWTCSVICPMTFRRCVGI